MLLTTITVTNICKRHKTTDTLIDISFEAKPGRITAFLGPNGAGKSSTLRIILGLDHPSTGTATFDGKLYTEFRAPLKNVGAMFDGIGGSHMRKVRTHLKMIAQANSIPIRRVSEVLSFVDMTHKSKARLGTLSLGEGQKIGLAIALLGNPQYLVLDEPMNGLDPGGMRTLRTLIRNLAKQGKTILLSSHLLSEMEMIADDVVMINHGKIIATGDIHLLMKNQTSLESIFFSLTEGRVPN